MAVILYIHGMGGGGDSRVPSILRDRFGNLAAAGEHSCVKVVVKTYDFDPEEGHAQILSWVDELRPALVIGESLGALQAMRIAGMPHLFVSPALNSPLYFRWLAWLSLVPGVTPLLDRIYKPKEGDRQKLNFTFGVLRKYGRHRKEALRLAAEESRAVEFFAFFGSRDHYRRSGIVSVRTWKKYLGDSFAVYDGTHFMEEEYIDSMLLPKILNMLGINQ